MRAEHGFMRRSVRSAKGRDNAIAMEVNGMEGERALRRAKFCWWTGAQETSRLLFLTRPRRKRYTRDPSICRPNRPVKRSVRGNTNKPDQRGSASVPMPLNVGEANAASFSHLRHGLDLLSWQLGHGESKDRPGGARGKAHVTKTHSARALGAGLPVDEEQRDTDR